VDGNETGSNAGADFAIRAYDDAGAFTFAPLSIIRATGESTFSSTKTYSTGNAIGVAVQHNLTIPNGVNVGLAALGGVNSNLNLTLQGSTTVANTGRQGLEGSTSISFTGAGTLTMTQGSTVRAFSALSSVYAFNGSAVGTITHLAGLRICFPDNVGSAVNITNNYALLINNQTTGTGTVTYTNRWGIYQEGVSDLNYFAGNSLYGTTTNVGAKISIAGYMYISNRPLAQIVFNSTGTYYGQLQNDAADKWSFARNTVNDGTLGTPIMTWDAINIRVGINTSSPNSIFEVKSTGTGLKTLVGAFRDSSTNGNGIEIYNQDNLSSIYSTYYSSGSNQDLGFFTTTNTGTQNEVLRLTSTQRVGISTSTPQYKLDITALGYGVQQYGDVNNSLRTYVGSGYQVIEATNSGTVNQFGYSSGGFYIDTSANTRFRITTGGNVLINTNTNNGQTLQVNGTTATGTTTVLGIDVNGEGASSTPAIRATITSNDSNAIIYRRSFSANTASCGILGQLHNSSSAFVNYTGIYTSIIDNTAGSEDGQLFVNCAKNGTLTTEFIVDSNGIKTSTPTGGTAAAWKLGSRVAATVVVNTTEYIEVDIGGTLYKLATVT
jgi:hypothetical protein